ncbi:hypothetical protein [Nocardia rhamnosiphila]
MSVMMASVVFAISGCGVVDKVAGNEEDDRSCAAGFNVSLSTQNLGPEARFEAALETAATGTNPTTLRQVAGAAGWAGSWDTVVDLYPGITQEDLDRITGLSEICWRELPLDDDAEGRSGLYLFLDRGKPVETLSWLGYRKFLVFPDSGSLRDDTELVPRRGRTTIGRVLAPAGA